MLAEDEVLQTLDKAGVLRVLKLAAARLQTEINIFYQVCVMQYTSVHTIIIMQWNEGSIKYPYIQC